jgi:hypothetical protein
MWRRRLALMRTRFPLALLWASWSALKSPAQPGIAMDTNRSFPKYFCQVLLLTRRQEARSWKMVAKVSLRWAGSSMVWRTVSMIQPRISLRVLQLPSPL